MEIVLACGIPIGIWLFGFICGRMSREYRLVRVEGDVTHQANQVRHNRAAQPQEWQP